jgi:hypothetical protein
MDVFVACENGSLIENAKIAIEIGDNAPRFPNKNNACG